MTNLQQQPSRGKIPSCAGCYRGHLLTALVFSVFSLVLSAGLSDGLRGAETGESSAVSGELYARLKQASVAVLVNGHLGGSGSLIDAEGWVITAAHVIRQPGLRVELLSSAAGRCNAEVVAIDMGHDLALLRAEPRDGGYPFLPLADAMPPVGAEVYLVGTPIFRHTVMFRGIVARDESSFEYLNVGYVSVLTVTATVPSGTSGAAWVDRHGALIGVQAGVMSSNGIPVGVAFAGLGSAVKRLLETRQNASTPNLGAAVEEPWQQGRDIQIGRASCRERV